MKKKVVSMHVFAAFLAAGMLCLSAPAGLASDRSYTREDLDQAISQIRSWFYNPTPEVELVAVPGGEDHSNWAA